MSGRFVYLVPGFFGFTSLGDVNYFYGVEGQLTEALRRRGLEATLVQCRTRPTGSIRRRAARLLEDIEATGGHEADTLHFVGHSTGGLDIRLLTTPGVRLRADDIEERIGERTRSVLTVSTPHYGTPLASFFTTLPGRRLLELLTMFATTSGGRYSLYAIARILATTARLDDYIGRRHTFLDTWVENLLSNVRVAKDDPLWEFFREIASDQGAIIQLTPEAMNLFNAAVVDRPGVHYASLVTAVPTPPGHYRTRDLVSPARLGMAALFVFLHLLASREHRHYPYPHPASGALEQLSSALPFEVTPRTNDGIVPALSQVYGKILGVAVADHLDVVGQFASSENIFRDWLPSGAGFDEAGFASTWDRIAEEIAAAEQPRTRSAAEALSSGSS